MKIQRYLLFLLLLTGCSYLPRPVVVKQTDGTIATYKLLSVRDSSIVVFPIDEEFDERTSISHAAIIPNDRIVTIHTTPQLSPAVPMIILGIPGLVLGGLVGYTVKSEHCDGDVCLETSYALEGLLIGAAAGVITGYLLSPDTNYDLKSEQSRQQLEHDAFYRDEEPPALKLLR